MRYPLAEIRHVVAGESQAQAIGYIVRDGAREGTAVRIVVLLWCRRVISWHEIPLVDVQQVLRHQFVALPLFGFALQVHFEGLQVISSRAMKGIVVLDPPLLHKSHDESPVAVINVDRDDQLI